VVAEDDVLVLRKQGVVVDIAQPVRVLAGGLKLHQIDDVDHPNFQLRQMLPQDGNGRENLERRRVAAAGITTSGSAFWSLPAHCQMPIPSAQCTTRRPSSAIGAEHAFRPPRR